MASADVEKKVFDAFVSICPNFAGREVTCSVGANPPDFLCVDPTGVRIGVELSEWLDEDQIARERPQYQVEEQFLEVIDSRRVEPLPHIGGIWIFENEGRRLLANEASAFREQLYRFLGQLDAAWTTLEDRDDPQGVSVSDFFGYPLVAKYIHSMSCWSQARRPSKLGAEWITFMAHGGAYSPDSAIEALEESLKRKTAKYGTLKASANLAELHLLLYYDQGYHYNTPFDSPGFGFPEIASHLSKVASGDHGAFDRIFLFIPATKELATIY